VTCVGSKYKITEVRESDGMIRKVPYVLAIKMQERGDAEIIGGISFMAEKEIRIKKTDGSIHQLPIEIAEGLIAKKEATLFEDTKVAQEEEPEEPKEEKAKTSSKTKKKKS